jgi:hypothetical protein
VHREINAQAMRAVPRASAWEKEREAPAAAAAASAAEESIA